MPSESPIGTSPPPLLLSRGSRRTVRKGIGRPRQPWPCGHQGSRSRVVDRPASPVTPQVHPRRQRRRQGAGVPRPRVGRPVVGELDDAGIAGFSVCRFHAERGDAVEDRIARGRAGQKGLRVADDRARAPRGQFFRAAGREQRKSEEQRSAAGERAHTNKFRTGESAQETGFISVAAVSFTAFRASAGAISLP
jgi:hypothetical protein